MEINNFNVEKYNVMILNYSIYSVIAFNILFYIIISMRQYLINHIKIIEEIS